MRFKVKVLFSGPLLNVFPEKRGGEIKWRKSEEKGRRKREKKKRFFHLFLIRGRLKFF